MSFTSIIRNSERKYIFLLIIICFLHGFHGFIYSCIPFIFFDPILTCSNTINGVTNYFPCDQNTACDNFPYKIDYASSRQSITTEFELICSKRYIKPTIQSFISFGCTITALILSFVRLNPYQRSRTIMISYFIALVCAIISSFLKNIWAITFVLFISYLFSYVWISNIYTYASETFEPKLKKIVPSIMAICFGIFTMIFSLFTMVVSNWRYYVTFFYGIPPLIFLILFYLYNKKHNFQPKNLRKADEKTKALNNFPEKPIGFFQAFKIKSLRVNILLYLLIWNLNSILYAGCGISLSSFSGQLNITMFFLGAVQTTCSYISGNLILEFKEEILLKITTSCMAIFFVIFFFEPKNKLNVESYASFIFTVLMVLGNIGLELNWPILVNFLQRHVPIEFQQNVFSLGSTRLITFLVPYYIEFMVSLSISPIFGFGILAFFARVFLSYATKPEFSESNFSFLTDKLIESSDFKRMELIEIEKKGNATKDYNLINNSV